METRSPLITATDLAAYVVCPEAWRLKYLERVKRKHSTRAAEGKQRRQEWVETHDTSTQLKRYAKIVYLLLVAIAIVVFLLERQRAGLQPMLTDQLSDTPIDHIHDVLASVERRVFSEVYLLLAVLGVSIFIWDLFDRRSKAAQRSVGLNERTEVIALQNSNYLPSKQLVAGQLALSSKPDAIIKEEGFIIPVDIHPFGNKVKDRHVVPMLLHCRLVAELEGKEPPYGLLIMGEEKRSVRVKNTPEKQRWLQTLIDEMRSIIDGVPAIPAPKLYKCKSCDVRAICAHSAYREDIDRVVKLPEPKTKDSD